ncbi:hypothetical protein [Acinetobacter sp. NIPH 298]|uniref:hypothetical protein n=1 Tax=Acinetobacter sp. NIPH 298 TaxID=1217692 RepID=UPI0002CDAE69|nr:hypothetical protein [Acinetobacter sp. NIPH 298]ENW96123.1 hypothetical protein F903_01892 [Acinetobacter sp. NIPH 298]
MKKFYLYLFLCVTLCSCESDWKAKIGIGCFMDGKLCFEYFDYSNSYEKYLILISNDIKYRVEVGGNWSNWLDCQAIDTKRTICSLQQLNISMDKLRDDCKGKLDIKKYPKDYWVLRYYSIDYHIDNKPPYSINEINEQYVERIGLRKWMNTQSINDKQEILCPN